jgi:SAM-dependent methyltransferase
MFALPGRVVWRVRRHLSVAHPAGPALVPATPKPVNEAVVEVFERRQIVGWVEVDAGAPPVQVGLYLNDTPVSWVAALDPTGRRSRREVRQFRFPLFNFWRFAKTTDRVSVRIGGRPVPIKGRGMYYHPRTDGSGDLDELLALLAGGYVFSDTGRIQLSKSFDDAWKQTVLGLYGELRRELHEFLGVEPFLAYGTLLGAIREDGFIGHDHDFDCAYLSAKTDPAEAARELQEIGFRLIGRGYRVRGQFSAIHVFDKETNATRIDLFHLYFEDGVLQFPFGLAGEDDVKQADWQGLREIDFVGTPALVPVNAEAVVAATYGPSWHIPNPGFNWARDRTRRAERGLLTEPMVEEIYWSNFYAHTEFDSGSTFFDLVNARDGLPATVVDLGCGDGRDSFAFARSGRAVFGVDRSEVGVAHATRKAVELSVPALTFEVCDVGDAAVLADVFERARAAAAGGTVLYYARFFLHSIPEGVQETLLDVIRGQARPGDCFAAEFRTDRDEAAAKVHSGHYRRFQSGAEFGRRLRAQYGFNVLVEQEGNGLSPYQGEDPYLYRVIARLDPVEAEL